MDTIKIMGAEIPRYKDCPWCGAKNACKFGTWTYSEPCDKCKSTEKYQKKIDSHKKIEDGIEIAFKNKQIAGVWQYKGRNIYTNHKGDVINDEPYRPLKAGDPDWKHKT